MKIGIIGAGYIGQALAKRLSPQGYQVMLSNSRGADAVREIAEARNCLGGSSSEAALFGEVIIVAIPLNRLVDLPIDEIGKKIVIDTCNYYPNRDGIRAEFETGPQTTSGYVQSIMPEARVVKAFNSIMAPQLSKGGLDLGTGQKHALPIAANDPEAAEVAAKIVRDTGLHPVFTGPLSESWRFERARPAYCIPMDEDRLRAALQATNKTDFVPEGSWRS